MGFLDTLSPGVLAFFVFALRLTDVTLGTMRTISVVHGRTQTAVVLGFVEILIWIAAVSQVIQRVNDHPSLMLFYAGGFAAGNAVGIALERRLAMGSCVVTMVSKSAGSAIASALRDIGQRLTMLNARGATAPASSSTSAPDDAICDGSCAPRARSTRSSSTSCSSPRTPAISPLRRRACAAA